MVLCFLLNHPSKRVTIHDQKVFLPFAALCFLFQTWQSLLTRSCDHLTPFPVSVSSRDVPITSPSRFSSQSQHTPGSPKTLLLFPLHLHPSQSLSEPFLDPFRLRRITLHLFLLEMPEVIVSVHSPISKELFEAIYLFLFPANPKEVYLFLFSREF